MSLSSFVADVRAAVLADPVRLVYRAHASPGRVRYRLSWLPDFCDDAPDIADALSAVDGVVEARVRAFTGSVLVLYDPEFVDEERIARALFAATGVDHLSVAGHESQADLDLWLHDADERGSAVSRQLVSVVEALHIDFLRVTGGRVSLSSASALVLLGAAAGRFFADDEIELPSWHQLLWYAYQTFKDIQERFVAAGRIEPNGDAR